MNLGTQILLVVGELMGDMALPVVKKQCKDLNITLDDLDIEKAEALYSRLENILRATYAQKSEKTLHKIKVIIADEKYRAGLVPRPSERQKGDVQNA